MGINNPGVPGANLPASEDHVMRRLADLERAYRELGPSVARSFAPVIADLQAKQATLDATVATLNTTVSGLASAVADISTLVGQQTTGTAGNATTGGAATLTLSAASYAVVTINVPSGYTVAAVNANTAAAIGAGAGIAVQIATRIGGLDGPTMNVYTNGATGNGASNFSRVFTVTSGGTFTVETRAFLSSGSGSAILTTAAGVTFYR